MGSTFCKQITRFIKFLQKIQENGEKVKFYGTFPVLPTRRMQLKTISENSPVSSPKMVRTKRGKRKTDESEETANETLEINDTSTVDEMKENELKNGANIDVSPKKLCNIKETK